MYYVFFDGVCNMAIYRKRKVTILCTIAATCLLRVAMKKRAKRRSCWTRSWIARRETLGFSSTLVQELQSEDMPEYRQMFRIDQDSFHYILDAIHGDIERENTIAFVNVFLQSNAWKFHYD
jgi:hypothetical protein